MVGLSRLGDPVAAHPDASTATKPNGRETGERLLRMRNTRRGGKFVSRRKMRRHVHGYAGGPIPQSAKLEPFPIRRNRKRLYKSLVYRVFEPENRLAWLWCPLFLKTL
jgi:hypothetical protein